MIKKISILILTIIMISNSVPIIAEESQVITDPVYDVLIIETDIDDNDINITDKKPNIDIINLDYHHSSNSKNVTLILEVEGEIENIDFPKGDIEDIEYPLRSIIYTLSLLTNHYEYEISYCNGTCTVNGLNTSYQIDENELIICFNLLTKFEEFQNLFASTNEFEMTSIYEIFFYMDFCPNDQMFSGEINAPDTANVDEVIHFEGIVNDKTGLSQLPYNFIWDFDDGTPNQYDENTIHAYEQPGQYTISLTINDSSIFSCISNHIITIFDNSSKYDVNQDGVVDFQDCGIVWIHRSLPYHLIYDMNDDGVVDFQDCGIIWINRD